MHFTNRMYPEVMTCVYRLYDNAGRLLYVGVAYDFDTRFKAHAKEKDWWPLVAHRDITWFDNRFDAMYEEARAIENESPIHNDRQGIHPFGLMVFERTYYDLHTSYRNDGDLVVSSFEKERIIRDVIAGRARAVVALEGQDVGVALSWEHYLACREALGEGEPDIAAMKKVDLAAIIG